MASDYIELPIVAAGGGSGTVTSVSVVTANGLSGTVASATTTPAITLNISALDAAKIADGSVTSTEFQYLDGVTSNIQTQLNAKGAGTVTTISVVTANGLSGSVANATTTPAVTLDVSALDAAKIANGSVSNAEFQYLDGATSSIQTQLNTKISYGKTLAAISATQFL